MLKTPALLAALTALAMALPAASAFAAPQDDYLAVQLGEFNALRDGDHAAQYGLEYRFSEYMYGVHPIIGVFGTNDGSAYGYAGFNWNVALLPNQLYLVPNFAVGAYREGGGKDLGGTLEFRSGIELDYQFPNEHQLGIALNHLSNAGIYKRNPGVESVLVTYSIPTKQLF